MPPNFRPFQKGQALTADLMNSIREFILSIVIGGRGILVKRSAGRVVIELSEQPGTHSTGGASTRLCKFSSLDTDGDSLLVYLSSGSGWQSTTTSVLKPYFLRKTSFDGKTITYADGASRDYSTTSLDDTYQRRATWSSGSATEVQEITSPYAVDEHLLLVRDADGNWTDLNTAGRHWAVREDLP